MFEDEVFPHYRKANETDCQMCLSYREVNLVLSGRVRRLL